jgi:site-specific recombinase XerD
MADNLPMTDLVRTLAQRIAHEAPDLEDLRPEDLERLARVVVAENLRDALKQRAAVEAINYPAERDRYLERQSSPSTRRAYADALARLDAWCKDRRIAPAALTPAQADDWIVEMAAEGRAPASVRLTVAAASAFWTWLERRHAELRNPFRGTRARPKGKPVRTLAVPNDVEICKLEASADRVLRAAIVLMAQAGLRVGALPGLRIKGERFTTTTKGREQVGKLPEEARPALERAGLSLRTPFADLTVGRIADRFRYLVGKLQDAGEMGARYSVHDLRHAFAVRVYEKSGHDLHATKRALGHTSIQTTERYLQSLGAADV